MKKALYATALVAVMFASCTSEDGFNTPEAEGNVIITAALPEIGSRAFGDGSTASKLTYYVYDAEATAETKTALIEGAAEFEGLQATVNLALGTGKKYDIIFWADSYGKDAVGAPYRYDAASQSVTVTYGTASNDEARDAFFYTLKGLKVSGTVSRNITLRRPFAQINIGTSDLTDASAAGISISQTGIYIEDVPTRLNLYSGEVSDEALASFTMTSLPQGEDFPVTNGTYDYLAMNYILVGTDKSTVDVHFISDNTANPEVLFSAVPVRRNYRTNIYGALLTDPATFNVKINDAFSTPALEPWDGETVVVPTPDSKGNYSIKKAEELAGVLQMVSEGADLAGKTVKLTDDISLSGQKWNSIGTSANKFNGIFDGQDHKIAGLTAPLFGNLGEGAEIKDVELDAESNYSALAKQTDGNVNISGVTINGQVSKSSAFSKLGCAGLVSYAATGTLTIDNCRNNAEIADNAYCAGGLVGRTACPVVIKNSENHGKVISTRYSEGKAAGMIGMPAAETTIENCHNYGVIEVATSKSGAAGGLVGWFNGALTVTGSTNEADVNLTVSKANSISVAGGIYGGSGWGTGKKTFTNCENSGNVTVTATSLDAVATTEYQYGLYAGGIMGTTSYDATELTGCVNSGVIKAVTEGDKAQKQYVGGLVGAFGWVTSVNISGNTIAESTVLSGNQSENSFIKALYNYIDTPKEGAITDTPNTNNTSYPEK